MKNMRYLAALLTAAALLLGGCAETSEAPAARPAAALPVIVGEARAQRVELLLEQVGTLESANHVTLRAESEGRIIALSFEEGRDVRQGEVLVRLDDERIRAGIANLNSQLEELEVRLANRLRTLRRNEPLLERNLISPMQFDNLQAEIDEIRARISQVRAQLDREQANLAATRVRAPFDAVAGVRAIAIGDYLKSGDAVVSVVDLDNLEISFQVPERLKPKLSLGQSVTLRVDAYPERVFQGAISFIAPQVEVTTRTFQVKARTDNQQRLLSPGMFARVSVVTDVFEQAVVVPWESIIQTETETYLYAVADETARKVPVRLGKITPQWAHILHGELAAGDQVILEGKFTASDGARVAPRAATKR